MRWEVNLFITAVNVDVFAIHSRDRVKPLYIV
jgi:hypothetical protein